MALETATRIATWLANHQSEITGRIEDSVHHTPGTYSDGFAALVFALLGWQSPMVKALDISLSRPLESEFDGFAQALLLQLNQTVLPSEQKARLQARQLYQGAQLVSNNWALFRALTRELRGSDGDFSVLKGQLPSGLFPDSPLGQATPTCYHAKICAVLALQIRLLGDCRHSDYLQAGLEALLSLISPQGVLVPYGRSRNTLFGYGSAYLALRLGAQQFRDGRYSWAANRVLERITGHQHQDGHIPACLNDQEWLRKDWDVYINNPDYNAYAAACLLLAEQLADEVPPEVPPEDKVNDLGPIISLRFDDSYFACSTSGEFVPWGSPFFCDTRYAGSAPLVFDDRKSVQLFDQNYCWDGRDSTRATLSDPAASGWIPFLAKGARRYWARTYHSTQWTWEQNVFELRSSGFLSYTRARLGWQRLLENKILSRPARQMDVRPLNDTIEVKLKVNFSNRHLSLESRAAASKVRLERTRLEANLGA